MYSELGRQFETAVARRERIADNYGIEFGSERVFPELIAAMFEEVPEWRSVLEIGAATGLLTKPLLKHSRDVTALEPSQGMLRRLLEKDVAADEHLTVVKGVVEDLPKQPAWDVGVVTFTPRRGVALVRLLHEVAQRVTDRVVVLMSVDGTLDWAYLSRASVLRGFETRVRLIPRAGEKPPGVVLTVLITEAAREARTFADAEWAVDAREVSVPYPPPRGAATRLVRYFLSGGDRALTIDTDSRGVERLYGNLRTAVHRLGRDELTVRRSGDVIQLVRLPKADGVRESDGDTPFES